MYYVYVLRSKKNSKYYIGHTNNIERRLKEHNNGNTRGNRYLAPFELIYKEEYESAKEARKREYYIKRLKNRRNIENLIMGV